MQLNFGILRRAVAEDIAHDPHRSLGRIDIGIADHELFQNVVLNGPAQLLRRNALFFRGDNIERHDGQHCAVHRHRHRHLIQRNLVEQDLHVEDRIDGHARLAHIPGHALVVGVVSAMRGKIERDRKPSLSRGQIAAIKRVGLFGGRESGILPNRPRLHHVHRAVRPAQIRRNSRGIVEMLEPFKVLLRVEALHRNVFGTRATPRTSARTACPAGAT